MRRTVPLRAGLVARIYLASLLVLVVLAVLVGVSTLLVEPPSVATAKRQGLYVTRGLAGLQDRPALLELQAQRIRQELGEAFTLYRADGTLIVSNVSPPPPPLPPAALARLDLQPVLIVGARPTVAVGVRENGRLTAYGLFTPLQPRQRLSIVVLFFSVCLVFLGAISFFAARVVTRAFRRLVDAAHALGSGDLEARVRLDRSDELGEVGRAFDDMADRTGSLLRAQRNLLAGVSHELRTPLARIRVALDLADEGDAAQARTSLAGITEDLAEVERLVDVLLAYARLEPAARRRTTNGSLLRRQTVNASGLMEEAAARFGATHPSRPLELVIDGVLPPITVESPLFGRAIDNLLENAHKYSEPTTPLVLRGCHHDTDVVIEVLDRGIGIDEADLPRVFEPFFRGDRGRARGTVGSGLGLALVRRIVEAHGGAVTIESTVGVGTLVRVTIPVAASGSTAT